MRFIAYIGLLVLIVLGLYNFTDSKGWVGGIRQTDWEKTGYVVKDNPGMKMGVLYIVYEEPGSPALNAELKFDKKSVCELNSQRVECDEPAFINQLVEVEGQNNNGIVLVNKMTK